MKTWKRSLKRILATALAILLIGTAVDTSALAAAADEVASITDGDIVTNYATFADALANWTDGTTLTLLADVTGLTEYFKVYAKGLILDLNGHKIECSDTFCTIWIDGESGSELTIRDSKGDGYIQGEVYATGGSTLRLESGTVESVCANGNFTMTGGKIICEDNTALFVNNYVDVVISGGEISGKHGINAVNADSITVTGNAKITATNGYAIYGGYVNETIIDGTPTLSGTKAEFSTEKGIVFNTLPADGTVWRVAIDTKYNKNGIFAVPVEGITLDMGKFASAMDGYEVKQNAKGELLLCNHQTAYEAVSNEDGSTHKMLCCCGEITVEASVACSGFGATCQTKAVCAACGQSCGETNPDVHTFNDDGMCACGAERGEAINIDLSTLTGIYVISDSGEYIFTGSGSYGIKVESGNPKIVLNNVNISLTDGDYYENNPINGIHIATTGGTTEILVLGESSITAKAGAGIFVAEGGTVKITGSSREDILIATGASGCSGIGGYVYYTNGSVNCGNIEISSVTVKAFGSQSDMGDVAPAIGGAGNANCGYITIDNADVYAEGFISPYGYEGSSAIGTGADFIYYEGGTIGEISIINDSKVYVTRGNYCDYIGCCGHENAPADGVVNATAKSSTIYCYDSTDTTEPVQTLKYGALGGLLKEDRTCEGGCAGGTATCMGYKCANCGAWYGEKNDTHDWSNKDGICANGCGMECEHNYTEGVCDVCGYVCTHSFDESGKCGDCEVQAVASVTIGGNITYHLTLGDAITAVANCTAEDAAVVKLLDAVDLGNNYLKITSGVFTIDLGGKTVTGEGADTFWINGSGANVTFENGSIEAVWGCVFVSTGTANILKVSMSVTDEGGVAAYIDSGSNAQSPGKLYIDGATITSAGLGVASWYNGASVEIKNSSIIGEAEDINKNDATLTLGEDVTFPGGLTCHKDTLNDYLAEGYAYWQDGKMLTVADDATSIDGNVTVKAECKHESYTLSDYKPTDDGSKHTAIRSCCGTEVTEEHDLTYTADGNTITVSCSANCGYTGSATISASSKNCDGAAVTATVAKTGVLTDTDLVITYAVKGGEALTGAPSAAGDYIASITLGENETAVTASIEFTINHVDADDDGLCDGCPTRLAYLLGVTSRLLGSDTSVANISMNPSNGYVKAGEKVTVTAQDMLGYTFLGWYLSTDMDASNQIIDGRAAQSASFTYSYTPDADATLAAVYEAAGKVNVTFSGSGFTVSVDGGAASSAQDGNYTALLAIGSEVTIVVTDESFINWLNENKKIVTTEKEYTFTVTGDMTLTMSKKGTAGQTAMVEFVSAYNQVIAGQQYGSTDAIVFPDGPSKMGHTFTGWSLTENEIHAKIAAGETHITVTPVYEQDTSVAYTVTVYVDEVQDDSQTASGILPGATKTVNAPAVDGKVFLYWTDEVGNILGYDTSYFMQINKNVVVMAVYGEEEMEVKPVITMTNVYDAASGSKNRIAFSVTRDIPDGYTLVEHGIIANRTGFENPTSNNFILGATDVTKFKASDTSMAGVYTLNINVTGSETIEVVARGYMILTNNETGNEEIYYTDVASYSYNDVSATN